MSTTNTSPSLSSSLIDSVRTNSDFAKPSLLSATSEDTTREAWRRLIDYQLIELGRNKEQFEDEGIEPPTGDTVQLAISVAEGLLKEGLEAPNSVVPDANGGIVFERREKDLVEVIHVWDDGTTEYQCFQDTKLIERWPL